MEKNHSYPLPHADHLQAVCPCSKLKLSCISVDSQADHSTKVRVTDEYERTGKLAHRISLARHHRSFIRNNPASHASVSIKAGRRPLEKRSQGVGGEKFHRRHDTALDVGHAGGRSLHGGDDVS